MDFPALSRFIPRKQKNKSPWEKHRTVTTFLRRIYDITIGLTLSILNFAGVINMPSPFSQAPLLSSCCVCGAVMAVGASATVGLGVGLGVGLSCALKDNSVISNSTITNTTNSTNSTIFSDIFTG